jgi:radical SAM protein (TIGR01212 family)
MSLPKPPGSPQVTHLPYRSLAAFFGEKFGGRARKISLDAGFSCPNREGTVGVGGCVFCDPTSFSPSRSSQEMSIHDQIEDGIRRLGVRHSVVQFIAYFQPASNTYGPLPRLREAYQQAVEHPSIVGLVVGTRPDCAGDEVLDLLAELASDTWVSVEYGLQSIHDRTLELLNRGHTYRAFEDAVKRSQQRSLAVGAHVILGLPDESVEDMKQTARQLARLGVDSVKLHNLCAVKGTPLTDWVADGRVRLPQMAEYAGWVVDFLELLPADCVIDRLCGDAPPEYLVGPDWCLDKSALRRAVLAEFEHRGSHQGSRQ